jgi:uncharacterized membrane protein YfcA
MTVTALLWLILASFGTGAVNAVAGGGTLISFPALVALGLSPVAANATNTIALVPGSLASAWAYRHDLRTNRHLLRRFLLPSIVGGLLGATLVLGAPERIFELVVPWLVLGATLLILMKKRLWQYLKSQSATSHSKRFGPSLAILLMAVYGGYFGAGIGIITLAVLSLTAELHIHEMNGIKTLIASTVNGTAAVLFLARGTADVKTAALMSIGMILGGYFGARVARKTPPTWVERIVVGIGFAMTLVLAARCFK